MSEKEEKLKELRKNIERIYNHDADPQISAWHVREALRILAELVAEEEKP